MKPIIQKQGKSKRGQWSKAQREYVDRVCQDGCIICGEVGSWHHEKQRFHGAGMRAPHEFGLCLCSYHHTDAPDSVHRNPALFAKWLRMSEAELVDLCQFEYGWIK